MTAALKWSPGGCCCSPGWMSLNGLVALSEHAGGTWYNYHPDVSGATTSEVYSALNLEQVGDDLIDLWAETTGGRIINRYDLTASSQSAANATEELDFDDITWPGTEPTNLEAWDYSIGSDRVLLRHPAGGFGDPETWHVVDTGGTHIADLATTTTKAVLDSAGNYYALTSGGAITKNGAAWATGMTGDELAISVENSSGVATEIITFSGTTIKVVEQSGTPTSILKSEWTWATPSVLSFSDEMNAIQSLKFNPAVGKPAISTRAYTGSNYRAVVWVMDIPRRYMAYSAAYRVGNVDAGSLDQVVRPVLIPIEAI